MIRTALDPDASFAPPALFRLPLLRRLPTRIVGFGLRKVHVAYARSVGADPSFKNSTPSGGKTSVRE